MPATDLEKFMKQLRDNIVTDNELPEDCARFIHPNGRVDTFRFDSKGITRLPELVEDPDQEEFHDDDDDV